MKKYREAHINEKSAWARAYRVNHLEELTARYRKWLSENPNWYKEHYRKNIQHEHARSKHYRTAHPERKAREYFVRRLGITPTQELVDLKAKQIALVRAIRKQRKAEA